MARKLKTYTTSAGFFDLALSAPSMKAALDAWGATFNLFQRGMAHQTEDPEIVAATMKKPGVVLRRQVGTDDPFTENPELRAGASAVPARKVKKESPRRRTNAGSPKSDTADQEAARVFERERSRRERESRKEEARRQKENERRAQAVETARATLAEAERKHDDALKEIRRAQAALEKKLAREETRWKDEKQRLNEKVRAAAAGHLRLIG